MFYFVKALQDLLMKLSGAFIYLPISTIDVPGVTDPLFKKIHWGKILPGLGMTIPAGNGAEQLVAAYSPGWVPPAVFLVNDINVSCKKTGWHMGCQSLYHSPAQSYSFISLVKC